MTAQQRNAAGRPRRAARIRIVNLVVGLQVGATEVTDLVLALDRTRFEPRACCPVSGGPLELLLRERDVPVDGVGLPRPRSFLRGLGSTPGLGSEPTRLRRVLARERPDIAHGFLYERLGRAVTPG